MLRLQRTAGNRAVQRMLSVSRAPQLRTAQDSKLRVTAVAGSEYRVGIEVAGAQHPVGSIHILRCTENNQLPVHIEDFVDTATNRAWVVFSCAHTLARVRVPAPQGRGGGRAAECAAATA